MSAIDIRHAHALPMDEARRSVEQVAGTLSERFGVTCDWQGDTLHFARSGVDGRIALEPNQLHVTASLGFLLSAMKGPIESEIRRVLLEKF
ncbi:polyhydroxyalkanoic acid system family protein [Luteimonas kalidii]|uniref:Polyhydroxyalkanoic acid system family protein n=1 Tax=Luteimonas kalidii TaxID=3042025 RepID=A0ABT6JT65_9GAMM|nr:polyhydroxyalkanoic acid system family protein [Luteimonas kalidii]MDH5833668.1 polyhydroxyalkanoic acid system family protein [Luteimonas kalidii]